MQWFYYIILTTENTLTSVQHRAGPAFTQFVGDIPTAARWNDNILLLFHYILTHGQYCKRRQKK